ncbi:MAG: carboxymethylenebutenolidase [Chromatiales bacterium]|jgi:carboxymethylenebutenolidase|nr:carboxymethylenebutenolidase [Chromatiales bacterium]MDP6150617.1 dienelactone hydrolase family protein [Gammaproteobacteria bacterium]MDP7093463.1 dienelactone hydrolase family protein [Gammaproteobacteria bacterium]MDP7271373.1 dienelactone hydrolase family protein [Gammaproteobacteria bacterium]HJP05138.1 dienelactone hydrolase family protein [Gammaproteobacteria bacterium]
MKTEFVTLTASDGHELEAYVAHPEGKPKAGLLVLQEIFGLTDHIREVTEEFAADGFLAVAPAMFDRIEKGIVLGYTDFEVAREAMGKLNLEKCAVDMQAAADYARSAGKVGIVGYCWGGAMADWAACHGSVDAGVSYYGRATVEWLDNHPTCPMFYHYGERDTLIPWQTIEKIQRKRKGKVRIWGGAEHGFNCKARPQYHKASAMPARELTLEFFIEHLT